MIEWNFYLIQMMSEQTKNHHWNCNKKKLRSGVYHIMLKRINLKVFSFPIFYYSRNL